ncbi:MAG: FtsQ-type POTRA domain-containing protein [bacterium]|nr:FtsQ-type POTRA domain-containing protein [bacterium]
MKSRKTKLRKNVKIAPRISAAPRSHKKVIKKRALQISKIITLFLIIYATFFIVLKFKKFIIHSNYFCINNVIVNNDKFLDNVVILKEINSIKGKNIFTLDINTLRSHCEALADVKTVVIERSFPNTILVDITERIPIGQISYSRNIYGIDEDGVIIRLNESRGLPEIIGLKINNVYSGENITSNPEVSELIKKIITIIKTYNMGRLAEFGSLRNINVKESKNLILDFICQDNEIKIKIGKTNFEEKLAILEDLLSRLGQTQMEKLLYIDLRFGADLNAIPVKYRK